MSENNQLTGIVLSGGKSSRMGKDKGLCELNKKPLISYSMDVLSPICNQIIIGANNEKYSDFGYTIVKDEIKDIGPIGGIYSCLKASRTKDNFVLSCDMPLISVELIEYILSKKEGFDIVIPVFQDFPEPLCAYYNTSIVADLLKAIESNKYKIQEVVKNLKTKFLPIDSGLSFYQNNLFANINSTHELVKIETFLKSNNL